MKTIENTIHESWEDINSLKNQIQEAKEKLAILLDEEGNIQKYSPKVKISEKIPFSSKIQNPVITLEQEILVNQQKLIHILDEESKFTQLTDTVIKAKELYLVVKQWNKAAVVGESLDLAIPFAASSLISLPISAWNFLYQRELKKALDTFYEEIENHSESINLEHITTNINGVLAIEIVETLVEVVSLISWHAKIVSASLSWTKVLFSLRNKKKIEAIWIELEEIIEYLIEFLEQEKKTLVVTQES